MNITNITVINEYYSPELIKNDLSTLEKSAFCILDADIPSETIAFVSSYCQTHSIPVWFNPTDLRKCQKLIESNSLSKITFLSPNVKELLTLFNLTWPTDASLNSNERLEMERINSRYKEDALNRLEFEFDFDELKFVLKYMLKFVPFIVLTRGSEDLILASAFEIDGNKTNQLPCRGHGMALLKEMKMKPQLIMYPTLKLNKNEKVKF